MLPPHALVRSVRTRWCLTIFASLILICSLSRQSRSLLWTSVASDTAVHSVVSAACSSIEFPGSGEEHHVIYEDAEHPGSWPVQTFKTSSVSAPVLKVTHSEHASNSPGLIFLDQKYVAPSQLEAYRFGLYIFTSEGELVWSQNVPWSRRLQVQTLRGQPVLTYWSADHSAAKGISWGAITVLDTDYRVLRTICPHLELRHQPGFEDNACDADLHEGLITDEGTILVTAYNQTMADLSRFGGPIEGWVFDSLAYEIEISTGQVQWQWSGLEHIALTASRSLQFAEKPTLGFYLDAWDWLHLNSIQKVDGKYLINARNTFETYFVSPTGEVLWTFNGETGGEFGPLPADVFIAYAHDARIVSSTPDVVTLSIFNNANGDGHTHVNASEGLLLHLPLPPGSSPVRVLDRLRNPANPLYASAQGNLQHTGSNSYFMGYGYSPVAQEWDLVSATSDSLPQLVWEARFGHVNSEGGEQRSYRMQKHGWHATPAEDPAMMLEWHECGHFVGYVSWNGATDVEGWNIYVGTNKGTLTLKALIRKKGFETRFNIENETPCVQLGAVRDGSEIRRSAVVCADEQTVE